MYGRYSCLELDYLTLSGSNLILALVGVYLGSNALQLLENYREVREGVG